MNRPDHVIGYIEYLNPDGSVRERIPYNDIEKFKSSVYASLRCGEAIIPVVFPENLDQPLIFEDGLCFPWGLRSEKHKLLPYEIYQTDSPDFVFLNYDYAKSRMDPDAYKLVYRGRMECWHTLDTIYSLHNRDDHPNGRKMRSASVSDIIVTHEGGQAHAYYVEPIGYRQVDDLLPGLERAGNTKAEPEKAKLHKQEER